MNEKQTELIDVIQTDFQVTERPYRELGKKLNVSEKEAFELTKQLFKEGYVRRIGPFFNSQKLGFKSTLVAVKVDSQRLDGIAEKINNYKEVTHNYERDFDYNLWFTVIAENEERIETIIKEIKEIKGVEEAYNLPAKKMFKVKVDLEFSQESRVKSQEGSQESLMQDRGKQEVKSQKIKKYNTDCHCEEAEGRHGNLILDEYEKKLIHEIQGSLPLNKKPYKEIAIGIGKDENWVIEKIKQWREEGVIRRFGAAIKHVKAGYKSNAMVVWYVEELREDSIGNLFTSKDFVSHCYIRPEFNDFKFNLYTMIHANNDLLLIELINKMVFESNLTEYRIIKSLRELKKSSPEYY